MTQANTKKAPSPTYEVGYGKPGVHTRFRKGQSGNPSGRPKRKATERAKEIALQEAYRLVPVREGDNDLNMELLQAAIEYKAMAEREAERRRRLGIIYVDPNAPHPDDIVIDMHTGDVAMCHKDFAPLVRPRT